MPALVAQLSRGQACVSVRRHLGPGTCVHLCICTPVCVHEPVCVHVPVCVCYMRDSPCGSALLTREWGLQWGRGSPRGKAPPLALRGGPVPSSTHRRSPAGASGQQLGSEGLQQHLPGPLGTGAAGGCSLGRDVALQEGSGRPCAQGAEAEPGRVLSGQPGSWKPGLQGQRGAGVPSPLLAAFVEVSLTSAPLPRLPAFTQAGLAPSS